MDEEVDMLVERGRYPGKSGLLPSLKFHMRGFRCSH